MADALHFQNTIEEKASRSTAAKHLRATLPACAQPAASNALTNHTQRRRRLDLRLTAGFFRMAVFAFCGRQLPSALSRRTFQYSQARATGPGRKLYSPASRVSAGLSADTWPSVCA